MSAELPQATVTIDDEAGAFGGSTGHIVVMSCVATNADLTPRVYGSTKALLSQHGYSQGASYVASHIEKTRKPVVFLGLPIVTAGAVVSPVLTGVIGTSDITATAAAGGILEETNIVVTVLTGGTIGVNGIILAISMDGGRTTKNVRLGTATTYTIPYLGIVLNFAAGTLLAGDVFTVSTTAPMWDNAGITAARIALATQLKLARSWMVIGDLPTSVFAGYVTTQANAYETENQRFVYARVSVKDRTSVQSMAAWVAASDAEFGGIDSQRRIDLSLGRARKTCPITGWSLRRPAAWAVSIREYEHDLHIPTFRKADGPLDGWDLEDDDGLVVEFDERTDGGGLAARFTCLRTWSNGPRGAYVAMSLTRAAEGSLLSRTHNMSVANLVCSVTQAETENAIGQVLVLNDDGSGTDASLSLIEERVNSALEIAVLQLRTEGQRASKAVYRASRQDILNVPGAELTGSVQLILNGTLEKLSTSVRIQTAGA